MVSQNVMAHFQKELDWVRQVRESLKRFESSEGDTSSEDTTGL
jgi:hypothetical protein